MSEIITRVHLHVGPHTYSKHTVQLCWGQLPYADHAAFCSLYFDLILTL